jgi:16S rRNA (guanine527-N7)-methyltransferase
MIAHAELAQGLEALHLPLSDDVEKKLLDYVALIGKWNRVYNLTAVRDTEAMLTLHVLDSIAVAPHLEGESLLDIGSGAGLPGIPLAIVRPKVRVTLLEANQKKSAFQRQAVIELGLPNVEVANARAEDWNAPQAFDAVISRAFADLADFVTLGARFCASGGTLVAMKGAYPAEELERVSARVPEVRRLEVPGLAAERHLVVMRMS